MNKTALADQEPGEKVWQASYEAKSHNIDMPKFLIVRPIDDTEKFLLRT